MSAEELAELDKKEFVEDVIIEDKVEVEQVQEEAELSARDKIAQAYADKEAAKHEEPHGEASEEAIELPEELSDEVEVTINGFKKLASRDKVEAAGGVENYQKNVAANLGLQELAEQRKALQRDREELERIKAQSLPPADSTEQKPTSLPEKSDDETELFRQYHEAILYGDDDNVATELLEKIVNQRMQPATPVNYDEIASRAAQQTRLQIQQEDWQREAQEANMSFAEKFPDVAQDEDAFKVANNKTIELQAQHPEWPPGKIIEEAGMQVQQWLNRISGNKPSSTEDKVALKKNMRAVKPAAGRAPAKPQPKQQTNSEYIAGLRKDRGLE